ncbi:3-hydroxybutyryl-CoA dehydrogenase [Streptomyces phyllanthi]|uniref:3-hydroxybutyryl-CoA dehydrogenase n=1 Tax=Streptomyces phyllanthi TaxID=1803180 RepID=A0A5N8WAE5_9ACTN|nr:3-hydroxybutyryl-CoA dehydrogenase [Streptomyces phyllanthi]MPY44473.1 3-hydroxybutyryl-CoA dehydrogenase [Streptomyces phyllanthi]
MSTQPSGHPSDAAPHATATEPIRRVGVVGAGLMGSGIAEVCARAGLDVRVAEASPEAVEAGRDRITKSLARAVRSSRLAPADSTTTLRRIAFTTDLADLADRDIVIEAVAEDEQVKTEIFAALDKVVVRPDAILASNTSSIPIMKLGTATGRAQQVIGVHFFNPVPVLDLVELVPSLLTSDQTRDRAGEFVSGILGKQVIHAKDRAGFVVNSLLVPYLLSAIRMLESGLASADDIDNGMVLGCAHPMGPLSLADLIGLDTLKAIADSMYAEYKEPLHAAPPLLLRMVDAGLLGRKTSRGFHDYSGTPAERKAR